jgi:SAM-dependent methyltransferase
MKFVEHENKIYPALQTNGNAARFALPFAKELLQGNGLDIGCNNPKWAYPGSIMIDLMIDDEWDAYNLPQGDYDYIFSSHCLEHLTDWVGALDYWGEHLKEGGVMFLYLPDYSQTYWRPWNNRKHLNIITPEFIKDYFEARDYKNIIVTGHDLNNSFYGVATK